ncbi:5'-nucleotidase domain-containing protein 1-like isoform X2 [Polyodon spathula]|uniref:5'-nucleotidase domain-containing protein 1-like isoform X2 n=1 Tax=Polyodon spathula TaxID=7913 RepID=UPI001B7E42D5|nr:5'-nucleotidase domain-containing protein 1-like isoform X2 [Polyodon spathula]
MTRKDFEELFEVVITNAMKPGFFSQIPEQRPFRTLVLPSEQLHGTMNCSQAYHQIPALWIQKQKTSSQLGSTRRKNTKTPSAPSKQWGSYFVDVCKGLNEEEEEGSLKHTWCCHSINTYSTIAIPSIEAIADLPLDYIFPRFSPNKPRTTGYYPRPPETLLKMSESSPRE